MQMNLYRYEFCYINRGKNINVYRNMKTRIMVNDTNNIFRYLII